MPEEIDFDKELKDLRRQLFEARLAANLSLSEEEKKEYNNKAEIIKKQIARCAVEKMENKIGGEENDKYKRK